jgi:hypothetical protein
MLDAIWRHIFCGGGGLDVQALRSLFLSNGRNGAHPFTVSNKVYLRVEAGLGESLCVYILTSFEDLLLGTV